MGSGRFVGGFEGTRGVIEPVGGSFIQRGSLMAGGVDGWDQPILLSAGVVPPPVIIGQISSALCFQEHPLITGTVGLWQFNDTLADTSGNGNNLSTLNAFTFPAVPGGTEQYAAIDSCMDGFLYDGGTKLGAPVTPVLQLTGERTFEFILKQVFTFEQAFLCLCDPAGRIGGEGADRIGSVWTYLWDATDRASYFSKTMGSNIPTPHYGNFTGATPAVWGVTPTPGFHHYAFRNMVINGTLTASVFVDGVKITPDVTDLGTSASGVERFFVGGFEGGGENLGVNTIMSTLRVLNYGRTDADILSDAKFTLGQDTIVLDNCADLANFTVGHVYHTQDGSGNVDPGSFTVLSVNAPTCSMNVQSNNGWVLVASHFITTP